VRAARLERNGIVADEFDVERRGTNAQGAVCRDNGQRWAFCPARLLQRLQHHRVASSGIELSTGPRAGSHSIPVETGIIEDKHRRLNSLRVGMKLQARRLL
jgi:hypothetical protein